MGTQRRSDRHWRVNRLLRGTVVVMLFNGLASCTAVAPIVATLPPSQIIVPEHRRGLLAIRSGCTYLRAANQRFTIIWPDGFRWSAGENAVIAPDGGVFRDGDAIVTRGGDGSIDFFSNQKETYAKLARCGEPYTIANQVKGDLL